jgi:hypothetical protein
MYFNRKALDPLPAKWVAALVLMDWLPDHETSVGGVFFENPEAGRLRVRLDVDGISGYTLQGACLSPIERDKPPPFAVMLATQAERDLWDQVRAHATKLHGELTQEAAEIFKANCDKVYTQEERAIVHLARNLPWHHRTLDEDHFRIWREQPIYLFLAEFLDYRLSPYQLSNMAPGADFWREPFRPEEHEGFSPGAPGRSLTEEEKEKHMWELVLNVDHAFRHLPGFKEAAMNYFNTPQADTTHHE